MACEFNSFVEANLPRNYPKLSNNVNISYPYPTNSWFQNALVSKISNDRIVNAMPWFWTPDYEENTLFLSYAGINNVTRSYDGYNFDINEEPEKFIEIVGNGLTVTNLTDLSGNFEMITISGMINALPTRGSAFANFIYTDSPINIKFNDVTLTNLIKINGVGYSIDVKKNKITSYIAKMKLGQDGISTYSFVLPTNEVVNIEANPGEIKTNIGETSLSSLTNQIKINDRLNLSVDINSNLAKLDAMDTIDLKIFFYTTSPLALSGNTIIGPTFNGLLQIDIGETVNPYRGGYVTNGEINNFTSSSFTINYDRVNNTLLYLPKHWLSFNQITGGNFVNNVPNILTITHGVLYPFVVTSDVLTVSLPPRDIEKLPSLVTGEFTPEVSTGLLNLLKTRVQQDIVVVAETNDLFKMSRTILLANMLDMDFGSLANNLKTQVQNIITNNIQYDSKNGNLINNSNSSFGDILYSLYTLEIVNSGLYNLYPNQINNLLCNLVNPEGTTFSTKVRMKDFYLGHSFGGNGLNDSNSLEANGNMIYIYYAAYLLADRLNLQDLANAAYISLLLEIDALNAYFLLSSRGSSDSDFSNVGTITQTGKSFDLSFPMSPNTYPGKVVGIYGLKATPFTEVVLQSIYSSWIDSLATLRYPYNLTPSLVGSLINKTYQSAPNEPPSFFNISAPWDAIGLQLLARGSTSNTNIQNLWFNLSRTRQGESNTLYWLIKNGKMSDYGTTNITFNYTPQRIPDEVITSIPIPSGENLDRTLPLSLTVYLNSTQDDISKIVSSNNITVEILPSNSDTVINSAYIGNINPTNLLKLNAIKIFLTQVLNVSSQTQFIRTVARSPYRFFLCYLI